MKQFNLDDWLKNNKQKVITREGKPVKIIYIDSPDKAYPIVGFVESYVNPNIWDAFGFYYNGNNKSNYDLFFADDETIEETESLPKIKGWVKRSVVDGKLRIYETKECNGEGFKTSQEIEKHFSMLSTTDEPLEVEMIINKL